MLGQLMPIAAIKKLGSSHLLEQVRHAAARQSGVA